MMTPDELEARDAMCKDRDMWREKSDHSRIAAKVWEDEASIAQAERDDFRRILRTIHSKSSESLNISWLYSGKDAVEKLMREIAEISSENVKGHSRRADARIDQTPSSASDAPPCSISSLPKGVVILIKFMALRMLVGKSHGVDHKDLSTDERELRGTSNPSDGPLWFTQVILLLAINNQPLSESIVSKIDPFRPLPKDYLINWIASMLGDIDTQCAGNSDSINEIVNAIDRYLAVLDQRCDENSSLTILDDVRDDLLPDVGNDGLVKAHNVVFSNSSTNVKSGGAPE
jgi:hypothetical protein